MGGEARSERVRLLEKPNDRPTVPAVLLVVVDEEDAAPCDWAREEEEGVDFW